MKVKNLFLALVLPAVMVAISGCNHRDDADDRDVSYAGVGEMRIDEAPHTKKQSKQPSKLMLRAESPALASRNQVGEMDLE